jgi:hypothetical protein
VTHAAAPASRHSRADAPPTTPPSTGRPTRCGSRAARAWRTQPAASPRRARPDVLRHSPRRVPTRAGPWRSHRPTPGRKCAIRGALPKPDRSATATLPARRTLTTSTQQPHGGRHVPQVFPHRPHAAPRACRACARRADPGRHGIRRHAHQDAAQSDTTAALAQERYYSSYGTPDNTAADAAALAQEQSYSSYGTLAPTPSHIRTIETAGHDGVAPTPFVLTALGALLAGVGIGSGLHAVQLRRRRRVAGLAA